MISIDIIAEFDFLENSFPVGTLDYERVRGDATYLFEYDKDFLKSFPGTILSRDIGLFEGKQSCSGQIFSFLGDVLPDRWGRALIDKRELLVAKEKKRSPRVFDDFDYMVHLDDATRMGALRFYNDGNLINAGGPNKEVPIIADLEKIIRESQAYEKAVIENRPPRDTWINNLWAQGSSLGGARPKANVRDAGELYIAKIPSVKDAYDIALWEYFALTLAKKAGIKTADTKIIRLPASEHHTLLSKRFDRRGDSRIHYASSLTLTGLKDGAGQQTNRGYLDIVNTMISDVNVFNPMDNIRELYRRIAFNILIGNHDDHFRNHGFLLTKKGWELSPAFDINPTNSLTQSLMITETSNDSHLKDLYNASESYLLDKDEAREIIEGVRETVLLWRNIAKEVGISKAEQQRFSSRIDQCCNEKIGYSSQERINNQGETQMILSLYSEEQRISILDEVLPYLRGFGIPENNIKELLETGYTHLEGFINVREKQAYDIDVPRETVNVNLEFHGLAVNVIDPATGRNLGALDQFAASPNKKVDLSGERKKMEQEIELNQKQGNGQGKK